MTITHIESGETVFTHSVRTEITSPYSSDRMVDRTTRTPTPSRLLAVGKENAAHRCAGVEGLDEPEAVTRAALPISHGQALLSAGPVVCGHLHCVGQYGRQPQAVCAYQVVESLSRRARPAAHIKESS